MRRAPLPQLLPTQLPLYHILLSFDYLALLRTLNEVQLFSASLCFTALLTTSRRSFLVIIANSLNGLHARPFLPGWVAPTISQCPSVEISSTLSSAFHFRAVLIFGGSLHISVFLDYLNIITVRALPVL